MLDLGYESHNELINLGSVFLFICLYLFLVLLYFILSFWMKKLRRYWKVVAYLNASLFYGEILTLGLEAYLEFLIGGYLGLKRPLFTRSGEILSTVTSILCTPLTVLFIPFKLIHMLTLSL